MLARTLFPTTEARRHGELRGKIATVSFKPCCKPGVDLKFSKSHLWFSCLRGEYLTFLRDTAPRGIILTPLWSLALVPRRSAMLPECLWRHRISSAGHLQRFRVVFLLAQRGQNSFRSKRRFPQANAGGVEDRIGDGWNRRCQRPFARLFGAERPFR